MVNKNLFTSLVTSGLVAITMACEKPRESKLEQQAKPDTQITSVEKPIELQPIKEYTKEDFYAKMQREGWEFVTNISQYNSMDDMSLHREDNYKEYEFLVDLQKQGYETRISGIAFGGGDNRYYNLNSLWRRKKEN